MVNGLDVPRKQPGLYCFVQNWFWRLTL